MADSYCPEGEGFTGRESLQKGYGSIEEQVQDYIRLFLALQQTEEEKKGALFPGRGSVLWSVRLRRAFFFRRSACVTDTL